MQSNAWVRLLFPTAFYAISEARELGLPRGEGVVKGQIATPRQVVVRRLVLVDTLAW